MPKRVDYRKTIFVSYATEDQAEYQWLKRLKQQLRPLTQLYEFDVWDDARIKPGRWLPQIKEALDRAAAAVLLVGPAFLASDFITNKEIPTLLKRAEDEGMPLLILVTQHCHIGKTRLAEFQAFKEPYQPLEPLEAKPRADQNRVLKEFSGAVKDAVEASTIHTGRSLGNSGGGRVRIQHNLPIKPTHVVGRNREQSAILSALQDHDKPIIVASGFGGVGKSTVAKLVAWKCVERRHPFKLIAWVDVRRYGQTSHVQAFTFRDVLDSIAKAVDPTTEIVGIGDLEVKTARIRELFEVRRSLLVFDNYESLLERPAEEEKTARFINSLPIGSLAEEHRHYIRVLITTRVVPQTLSRLPMYNEELERLPVNDSVKMMKSLAGAPRLTRSQWKRVSELLHGLPKYMQVAVGQLKVMTFTDWEENATRIKWRPRNPDDFFFDLFDFSWRNPQIISRDLRRILLAMTYFVGHAPPNELRRTTGLNPVCFRDALAASYSASYVEVIRKRSDREYYSVHPLMHAYARAALMSKDFQDFREESSARFVCSLLTFIQEASGKGKSELLDEESQNIVAAARIAGRLESWQDLIEFRKYVGGFLRSRGYWLDYQEIVGLAVEACRALGEEQLLGECLVYDLAWYYLRLEDIGTARKLVKEGQKLFQKHKDRQGIAQAMRHLGKAALLEGLDSRYLPRRSAEAHFTQSQQFYNRSLAIRKRLQREGTDQRLAIADIKLDFGRLYWLQGIWLEQEGRRQRNACLLGKALRKYKLANRVTEEARSDFREMSLRREVATARLSKVCGNLGNATKEIASYMAKDGQWSRAMKYAKAAEEYYGENLAMGESISKKDEIAHALAGLAELRLLQNAWGTLATQPGEKEALLERAKKEGQKAHRLYEELAGPRAQIQKRIAAGREGKTRDEVRTDKIVERIQRSLESL